MSVPQSDSVLASVQAEAQAEASRFFGDSPAPTWSPSSPWVPALLQWSRVLGVAAAVCCVLAAVIGGVAWSFLRENSPEPPEMGNAADDVVDTFEPEPANAAPPSPPRHTTVQSTTAPSSLLNITRQGAEWRIEAFGVSRMLVAQRLSQVSGSPLSGDLAALTAARPVQLSWKGRDTADAWQAVLGHDVSFATQCSSRRCRVWIAGVGAAPVAPPMSTSPGTSMGSPSIATPMALPVIAPPPMPATMEVAAAPPQSDSADPRVAAHHD